MVQQAQASKAPIQEYADKISAIFVPVVLVVSAITLFGWIAAFEFGWISKSQLPVARTTVLFAVERAISVLVIACPCALGLATPTAVMVGSGVAAKLGILIRGGGAALEKSNSVNTIVFDKTGTLTMGSPVVAEYQIYDYKKFGLENEGQFWLLVSSLESNSDHPLAKAICSFAKKVCDSFVFQLTEIHEQSGKGLKATVEIYGESFGLFVGNEGWMDENGCNNNSKHYRDRLDDWKSKGRSIVVVGMKLENADNTLSGTVVGVVGIADQIRAETKTAVDAIQKRGVQVWMLTGDHDKTAHAVAAQIGISPNHVISQVLPEEKFEKVRELQTKTGGIIAMVGDGINDSAALAQADVGYFYLIVESLLGVDQI